MERGGGGEWWKGEGKDVKHRGVGAAPVSRRRGRKPKKYQTLSNDVFVVFDDFTKR